MLIKKNIFFLFLLIFIAGQCEVVHADNYALVIGISKYSSAVWKDLSYAAKNAKMMAALFKKSGFKVVSLYDKKANKSAIFSRLSLISDHLGKNDSLVVYFAGHVYTERYVFREYGYLIPFNEFALNPSFINIDEFVNHPKLITKRNHQLFIIDACIGGIPEMKTKNINPSDLDYFNKIINQPSRQAIVAGGNKQRISVNDKGLTLLTSLFVDAIYHGMSDKNMDGFVTFPELTAFISTASSGSTQIPASFSLIGHGIGEFVFSSKGKALKFPETKPKIMAAPVIKETPILQQEIIEPEIAQPIKEERISEVYEPLKEEVVSEEKVIPEKIEGFEEWTEAYTGMKFIKVQGGCYEMGCERSKGACDTDERPIHNVCVDGFWMGKYEVTQNQWMKIMGKNPSKFKSGTNPVEKVNLKDAKKFIKKLNSQTGKEFMLPSEAQWEFACKGGEDTLYSGGNNVDSVAWYLSNSNGRTHSVGEKLPNAYGLYDMSGNVYEWCEDVYNENAYKKHSHENPIYIDPSDSYHVIRGGGWDKLNRYVSCTNRYNSSRGDRRKYLGFRVIFNK